MSIFCHDADYTQELREPRHRSGWCSECYIHGSHAFGCPEARDEDRSEVVSHPVAPQETCNQSTEGDLK